MAESQKKEAFKGIMNRVRILFHKFGLAASKIHGTDLIAIGKRAILEDLMINGPQTIPAMARKRPVSRQHILQLVKPLEQEGHVEFKENPLHKKSFLVALTDTGRHRITSMLTKEDKVLKKLADSLKLKDLKITLETLDAIQELLESDNIQQAMEKNR